MWVVRELGRMQCEQEGATICRGGNDSSFAREGGERHCLIMLPLLIAAFLQREREKKAHPSSHAQWLDDIMLNLLLELPTLSQWTRTNGASLFNDLMLDWLFFECAFYDRFIGRAAVMSYGDYLNAHIVTHISVQGYLFIASCSLGLFP